HRFGGINDTRASWVFWVVEYSNEVDFSSLVEHTFIDTFVIDELLVNFRRDLRKRDNQHPACSCDRVIQKFSPRNLHRHCEFTGHLCASYEVFHLPGLRDSGLLLWGDFLWGCLLYARLFWAPFPCGYILRGGLGHRGLLCSCLPRCCFFGSCFLALQCCTH